MVSIGFRHLEKSYINKWRNKMEEKIGFKNLSGWLKTAIVLLWISIGLDVLFFLIGFFAVLLA